MKDTKTIRPSVDLPSCTSPGDGWVNFISGPDQRLDHPHTNIALKRRPGISL